tara:strand:+ start:1909 stop:2556 length:648 start_codon:yes stop_codon:yes gene_type:complete
MSTSLDSANNLSSLSLTKEAINEAAATTTYDSQIRRLIDSVSHEFNTKTGRRLKKRSLTEYFDGNGEGSVTLSEYPIRSSTTGIEVYVVDARTSFSSDTDFSSGTKKAAADVDIRENEGQVYLRNSVFTRGAQNVKVVYAAGYSTTTSSTDPERIPFDLQEAVHESIHLRWQRNKGNRVDLRAQATENQSETYLIEESPYQIRDTIARYRDSRFA